MSGQRIQTCIECSEDRPHKARGLCSRCYQSRWKYRRLHDFAPVRTTTTKDWWRAQPDPDEMDFAVVERILGGEWRMRIYNPSVKVEVCRRWVRSGRALADLERLTGWATHRYYRFQDFQQRAS